MAPKSNNERQREYMSRIMSDPVKADEYRRRQRERWAERKERKTVKTVRDMNDREKRCQRRRWNDSQRQSRARKRQVTELITPPVTPEHVPPRQEVPQAAAALNDQPHEPIPGTSSSNKSTAAKQRCRRMARRDRSRTCRKLIDTQSVLAKVKNKIAEQGKQINKYRVTVHRLQKKLNETQPQTPRKQIRKLLKGCKVSKNTMQELVKQRALVNEILDKVKRKRQAKTVSLESLCSVRIMKKYKMKSWFNEHGIKSRYVKFGVQALQKPGNNAVSPRVRDHVIRFYLKDDVSRATGDKKQTIKRNGVRKAKRTLDATRQELHRRYLKEVPYYYHVSYATFCRLKPFWVVPPEVDKRSTCECIKCRNLKLMAEVLKRHKVLDTCSLKELSAAKFCENKTYRCAVRECNQCQSRDFNVNEDNVDFNTVVQWKQWKSSMKDISERMKQNPSNEPNLTRVTELLEISGTLESLLEQFHAEWANKGTSHIYRISHQYNAIKCLETKMGKTECVIRIDFAENYSNKYHNEIQSTHFGANRQQTTIHDGVVRVNDTEKSFATISNSTRHDPPAIWCYMRPVLRWIFSDYASVNAVHFISDGPTTQYRNRFNFYLFCTKLFDDFPNLVPNKCSWTFTEAGHGKSSADGVGAAIKSAADRAVAAGSDLPDAMSVFQKLSERASKIKLFYTPASEVKDFEDELPLKLRDVSSVRGTMGIHEIRVDSRASISTREVSCFCRHPEVCQCYEFRRHTFGCMAPESNNGPPVSSSNGIVQENESIPHLFSVRTPVEIPQLAFELKIDDYSIVIYDDRPYLGRVKSIDQDQELYTISVMNQCGRNKFIWPHADDTLPYHVTDIKHKVDAPQMKKRYYILQEKDWEHFTSLLDFHMN